MSETQWPHFLSPFCSFSSFSCLKAPLREMRAKTFTPSSLLWSLILAVFLPEKMRCATRLINCWNFLFHYQSWLQHVLFVLSPALSARLSVVYYLLPLSFNLDFIFTFLSFASPLYVSFFRKVNNMRSSLTSLPSSKPLIISFSPRTKPIVLKGQLSHFPALRDWEEGRNIWNRFHEWSKRCHLHQLLRVLQFLCPHTVYICNYYHAMHFWVRLWRTMSETLLYQSYMKTGNKKMAAICRSLCIRVCDVSWCWFLCR